MSENEAWMAYQEWLESQSRTTGQTEQLTRDQTHTTDQIDMVHEPHDRLNGSIHPGSR